MYSNTNAFLGGNSQRPGGQQQPSPFAPQATGYGQAPLQQQQQQQPSPFAPQPTGFGQAPLQQQFTGFPMQGAGLQSQQPQQQQQNFQSGAPPMPSIPPQFQQQFQQQQPQQQHNAFSPSPQQISEPSKPPPPPVKPQPTGFTEMAASFHTGGASKPRGRRVDKQSPPNKIPNIRLSFITAQDQSKFETLFKSAIGEGSMTMSGDKARDLLMRSRLDGDSLSHIWYVQLT